MDSRQIQRQELSVFSKFSKAFTDQTAFAPFLNKPFTALKDLHAQAAEKLAGYSDQNRQVLADSLFQQAGAYFSEKQLANLALLREKNTVTITTGHQLTLFGGPMFLVYKVLHMAKLAAAFNESQTDYKAVPIFWLASEDHDLDEVRSAHLFGKTFTWETPQTGAVGRMTTADFTQVLADFKALFEGKESQIEKLLTCDQTEYAAFNQEFLTRLFSDFGILVLQPDSAALKKMFVPVLTRELETSCALPAVEQVNERLLSFGWTPQAQAREINLFLLSDGKRSRIERAGSSYLIDGKTWSSDELLAFAQDHPEQFSPNVILRPVYQETILPNIAYIGGGGEMAYWVQLKEVFAAHQTIFPLIQQRNSLHVIDSGMLKRMEKLDFQVQDYFQSADLLKKAFIAQNSADEVDMSEVYEAYEQFKRALISKTRSVAQSLENMAEAESVKMQKQLEQVEAKLIKQVKQTHEQALKSIEFVCERFMPENTLQERYFHWLHFAADGNYADFFQRIYERIDPFCGDLMLLYPTDFKAEH